MIEGHLTRHDPHCGRHFKPRRLHGDKIYAIPHLRKWLYGEHIGVRIARKGVESSVCVPRCDLGRPRYKPDQVIAGKTSSALFIENREGECP